MFTGIIEEVGSVSSISSDKVVVKCKKVLENSKLGDSISVNGVCLTVTSINKDSFEADISKETMRVTNLGLLKTNSPVNLERALSVSDRFGGHIVSGHTDNIAKVKSIKKDGDFYILDILLESDDYKYTIRKGSICVNGVSLTIANLANNVISIAIIPHTFNNTNLKNIRINDFVNIEVDIVAKYIEKFLSTSDNKSRIDLNFLQENGF